MGERAATGETAKPNSLGVDGAIAIAIVVLGCRVMLDEEGRLAGALGRRVRAAARAYEERAGEGTLVLVCGGRHWGGTVEADAMARELGRLGVPESAIVRERCSLSTRENARYAAATLARRGIERVAIVTCAWHLARAVALFRARGLHVEGVHAGAAPAPWTRRTWRWGVERVLSLVQAPRS
ncbi:MAG TPA: YdcF family protein [Polyangiaceae bacterium]|jgi:uncharacterized SAM-binding protein YcdF (DUF218 family)